jgi:ribosomal protein L35
MKKSISKRIKVTKNGKMVRRAMATGHSRTRKNAKRIRQQRNTRGIDHALKVVIH